MKREVTRMEYVFLSVQGLILMFCLFHDWIPIGSLNDVQAVKAENSTGEMIRGTVLNSIWPLIGVTLTLIYMGKKYPLVASLFIFISYTSVLIGAIMAWWVPYLFGTGDAAFVDRYNTMFGNTHAFLPYMNGIVPNTVHVIFHSSLVLTLVLFSIIWYKSRKRTVQTTQKSQTASV
ncbi:hypothetical protein [Caldalkalibacillus salinus]|uniref:hypothetical protein n=1 Tax=Caldalkalibacillus salinus TaxID=2803787 RepID=UPI0019227A02|nr:hypothetical protein [Caldalkalibacillus salinus]